MKNPNLNTFLLFYSFIVFSQHTCAMKQQSKSIEINTSKTIKKTKSYVKFITDPLLFSDAIFPFIEKQSDLLNFRPVSQCTQEGVVIHSQSKPIKLKTIDPDNIHNLIEILKSHNLDCFVAITINDFSMINQNANIGQTECDELFDLLWDKIKELSLNNFDLNKISQDKLQKSSITKLEILNCENTELEFFKKLPEKLESLKISDATFINDEHLESLPKNLKNLNIASAIHPTGKFIKNLPNTIENFIPGVSIEKKYLKDLPKKSKSKNAKTLNKNLETPLTNNSKKIHITEEKNKL